MNTKNQPGYHRAINQLSDSDIHERTQGLSDIEEAKRQREQSQREFAA